MWPEFSGENGWEPLGTDVTGEGALAAPLPALRRGLWYEPAELPLGGATLPSNGFRFGGGSVQVRGTTATVQAALVELGVHDIAFLDNFLHVPVAAPCSLRLRVYEDDRTTVKWEVSTDPAHAAPYLMTPANYAEQSLDVAAGAASIGAVEVAVVDFPAAAGDQDSGLMTSRLAALGLADLAGRRARLERYVSEAIPAVVIADGPAGPPRLLDSYAGFAFTIRDVRETERRTRFVGGGNQLSLLPFGVADGYGQGSENPAGYLWSPTKSLPLVATTEDLDLDTLGGMVTPYRWVRFDLTANPLNRVLIPIEAWEGANGLGSPIFTGTGLPLDPGVQPHAVIWRPAGSDGPWVEVEDISWWLFSLVPPLATEPYPDADNPTAHRVNWISFMGTKATTPEHDEEVELVVLCRRGEISEALPFIVEGVPAGDFVRRVYDGEYSPRGPGGVVVPSGIRYSAAGLAQMTTPVRIYLTAPVDDARAWLEEHIYAPLGWVPAVDLEGRINPVSREAPADTGGLPVVDLPRVSPTPDWSAGERIVNVLRYSFHRDYRPGEVPGFYPIFHRAVILEFRDEVSIDRHGEQVLTLNGDAFRALGLPDGEALSAGAEAETGWLLAEAARATLHQRYSLGAPTLRVTALRAEVPTLRAGAWLVLDLPYLPDYVTARRGLLALGQIVAAADLDCFWRTFTVELYPGDAAS